MVDILTRYNPRVLDISQLERKGLRREGGGGGAHCTLSLDGLSGTQRDLLSKWASSVGGRLSTVVNGASRSAFLSVSERALGRTRPSPGDAGAGIEHVLDAAGETVSRYRKKSFRITHGKGTLKLGRKTCVMGVLNVTPDSFYDGGCYYEPEKALARAFKMIEEGADIIDIGGVSTRPGSRTVSEKEELRRIIPVIKGLSSHTRVPISVDTCRARVAEKALEAGAQIVNDVSGLGDEDMARVVASSDAPVVIMHMKGRPHRMPKNPAYKDLLAEITLFLRRRIGEAVSAGVNESNIIVDPGIGFGKSPGQSLEVLRRLGELRSLGLPIMVGTSNKSFIRHVLSSIDNGEAPDAGDVLYGTLATIALAINNGAKIVRVHQVREAVHFAAVCAAVTRES